MSPENVSVVLMHGAWAGGSSWAKVIGPLATEGVRVLAAPLPLTSFAEDTAAVERTLERFMAERMHARVRSHPIDHTSIVTAPNLVSTSYEKPLGNR